jgi:hypothetical protein
MMLITRENILSEIQRYVPNFRIDPDWLEDGLTYLVINDLARFICSEAEVLEFVNSEKEAAELSQVPASMSFLERALGDGDSFVRDLVFECVETLASCEQIDQIKKYFGPKVRDLWVQDFSRRT